MPQRCGYWIFFSDFLLFFRFFERRSGICRNEKGPPVTVSLAGLADPRIGLSIDGAGQIAVQPQGNQRTDRAGQQVTTSGQQAILAGQPQGDERREACTK